MAKTAIIVVNYQTPWYLDKCLQSVFKYTQDFHVFLVHNAPDTASLKVGEKYKSQFPELITIIVNEQNLGLVAGVNSAYTEAVKFDRVCFANSDIIVTSGWLAELNKVLDQHPEVVQVAPDSNSFYPETRIWRLIRKLPGLWNKLYLWRYKFNPPHTKNHNDFHTDPEFWIFAAGFCNLTYTKYFKELGRFWDPNIVHGYWDDFDTSYYLRQFGKIGSTSDSYVYHYLNVSLDNLGLSKQGLKQKLMILNGLYVMDKWRDRLLVDVQHMTRDTLYACFDNYVLRMILTYFGLANADPGITEFIRALPAREVGDKLLN